METERKAPALPVESWIQPDLKVAIPGLLMSV